MLTPTATIVATSGDELAPMTSARAVAEYSALVHRLVNKYGRTGADLADLEQEGFLALIKSARAWRPDGGASFLSYAWRAISGHLGRVCRYARRRGVSAPRGNVALQFDDMDAPVGEDEGATLHDVMAAPDELEEHAQEIALRDGVAKLPAQERRVMNLLLDGMNHPGAGGVLGLSRNRIGQIVDAAIERLALVMEGKPPGSRLPLEKRRAASVVMVTASAVRLG
jgi:RNA polymerase sigma factor (sigma-70 family)